MYDGPPKLYLEDPAQSYDKDLRRIPMQLQILPGKIHKMKEVIYDLVLAHSLANKQSQIITPVIG